MPKLSIFFIKINFTGDLMKKRLIIICSVLIFSLLAHVIINQISANIVTAFNNNSDNVIVILDAGHGGEDGGAVAEDGTEEKMLNLSISRKIALLFDIFDIDYIVTRDGDYSIGDNSLDTIRKRKNSDIQKRFSIVNETPDSILLSIHQNMFSVEKYSGAQVFYAPDCDSSEILAKYIQDSIVSGIQPENNRKIKPSNESIYLLYNAKRPSVLVECGFLSNSAELELLKTDSYQCKIAYFITCGLIDYLVYIKGN